MDFSDNSLRAAIAKIALEHDIDLTKYGTASPTKVFMEALIEAKNLLTSHNRLMLGELNPMTATTLKSLLGLASLAGYRAVSYTKAAKGKVLIEPEDGSVLIQNHASLQSISGFNYFIDIPYSSMLITEPTVLTVLQGTFKTLNATADGRANQIFMISEQLVDASTVSVKVNGTQRTVSIGVYDDSEFLLTMNTDGDLILVDINARLRDLDAVSVTYAESDGKDGELATLHAMLVSQHIKELNDNNDFMISIAEPIIGGTDKLALTNELRLQLLAASRTNLIGNVNQLEALLARFTSYSMRVISRQNYIVTVLISRNLKVLTENLDYWRAIDNVAMLPSVYEQDAAELRSLQSRLTDIDSLSLSTIVKFKPAKIQWVTAIVDVNMSEPNVDAIKQAIADYALDSKHNDTYRVSDLYKAISEMPTVIETSCSLTSSGVNTYGTVEPVDREHILVIRDSRITINGTPA